MPEETVGVEKLLNNGHGMARLASGELVFVPGALPGEQWRVSNLQRRKGALIAGKARRLLDGPSRATPPCPHAGSCGGCGLLHARRDRELKLKVTFLADNLRRVGGLKDVEIEPIDFPMEGSRARGKFHVNEAGGLGFKGRAEWEVTEVPECLVIPGSVRDLLPRLKELSGVMAFSGHIFFAADAAGEHPVFTFRGKFRGKTDPVCNDLKGVCLEIGGKGAKTIGNPTVTHQWHDVRVNLPATSFFQSNPASWPIFWDWVGRFLNRYKPKRIWDVHAGAGFLSSCLDGFQILATEPEPTAYAQLERGLRLAGLNAVTWCGTAEDALKKKRLNVSRCDAAVLDPPREGLSKPLRAHLRAAGPKALLYFSCDTASFSRDLAALKSVYSLASPVLAMNVNPGTLRLETSVILERRQ
ncbi:MAG: hypothetical protein QNK37_01085 [Acidobacteriota bacterium]|nr:hypothetical protein [Acidobacteriota bacterium]